ncbi:MAG TPA: hypothetical protein VKD72_31375, partial [Gemmataceae bacterium]|nr:hypothetical protein [Gemmataceae bacterium]
VSVQVSVQTARPSERFADINRQLARAGVRDPAALANLPEPERQMWQAFWQEVEGLLSGPVPAR